jgi:hypothetical protein
MTREPGWEQRLLAVFDDLEQQAAAAYGAEREAEVAERARAEYAAVTLAARLMAGRGCRVAMALEGVGAVSGELQRVAADWCLLAAGGQDWIIRLPVVSSVRGLPPHAVAEAAWPVTARLGLGSALRRVADGGERCRVRLRDGTAYDARLGRVGADFVEVVTGDRAEPWVVALDALSAVHSRET